MTGEPVDTAPTVGKCRVCGGELYSEGDVQAGKHPDVEWCMAYWKLEALSARSELRAELADLAFAAHMPPDYEHGLASWINQHLYAAYIGAHFSEPVMEQIHNGRLTFPDAPVYAERDRLRAIMTTTTATTNLPPADVKPPDRAG